MSISALIPIVAMLSISTPVAKGGELRVDMLAVLDGWVDGYLADQNDAVGDIRRGQFHGSDNMRLQECTALIAWAYTQPDSRHHGSPEALHAAVASIDYMCRAQGGNGGFNEYHGWCGVPDRDVGRSSVAGFTLTAIARAIEMLAQRREMPGLLAAGIDADGPGAPTVARGKAWRRMLSGSMENVSAGSGRGHSANQDMCALAAVYALNDAWRALVPSEPPLRSDAEVAALRDEILHGRPKDARNEYAGKWFSRKGIAFEGRPYAGYDANYAAVTLAYVGLCADYDDEVARFGATYWEALQYFLVPSEASALGITMEDGISRRVSAGDERLPPMWALGLTRTLHPTGERAYAIALPGFAADVEGRMALRSPHTYQIASYLYADWLDRMAPALDGDYRLPAERSHAWTFRDPEAGTLVTQDEDGVLTYYVEPWGASDGAREHVWGSETRDVPSRHLFPEAQR
jgi:hypothetical protein